MFQFHVNQFCNRLGDPLMRLRGCITTLVRFVKTTNALLFYPVILHVLFGTMVMVYRIDSL